MSDLKFEAVFNITDLGEYEQIPNLKEAMKSEFIRVYNNYCERTNGGITDRLNEEFENLYPNYFEDNKDKDWYDLTEYNKFMADGYQRLIVDAFNISRVSPLLDFYVEPEAVNFKGCLRANHDITIEVFLKEV